MTDTREYQLISADAHVLEPPDLFQKRVPAEFRHAAPRFETAPGTSGWVLDGLEPVPLPPTAAAGSGYAMDRRNGGTLGFDDVLPALYDPAERLRAQDTDSVDAEVLYPSPRLWDTINLVEDAQLRLACVRAYNDWIAEFCAHSPERLIGLGKIPSGSDPVAKEELLRCVGDLGLRGVILDAWPGGGAATNSEDEPFWAAVQETGVPVSIHYAIGAGVETLPPGGVSPGMRPPMADAPLPLVVNGIFDRYPNVRLVFAHGDAGWALHWLEFMDINYVRHRHLDEYKLQDPELVPSDYLRAHSWFTIHHDRSAVKNREKLGTSHLMWASNFPFDDSDWPDDRRQAMQVTEELPAAEQHSILARNTARLYSLAGEEGFDEAELRRFDQLVHF